MSTGLMIGLIVLAVFLLLLLIGLPVSVTMMVCGVFGSMFLLRTPTSAFTFLTTAVVTTFTSYSTCVAPMFILMGELASERGLAPTCLTPCKNIGAQNEEACQRGAVVCAIFGANLLPLPLRRVDVRVAYPK
jgi:TRAP-type mannitol/chloroaromatic compound transport system permease large subunit